MMTVAKAPSSAEPSRGRCDRGRGGRRWVPVSGLRARGSRRRSFDPIVEFPGYRPDGGPTESEAAYSDMYLEETQDVMETYDMATTAAPLPRTLRGTLAPGAGVDVEPFVQSMTTGSCADTLDIQELEP